MPETEAYWQRRAEHGERHVYVPTAPCDAGLNELATIAADALERETEMRHALLALLRRFGWTEHDENDLGSFGDWVADALERIDTQGCLCQDCGRRYRVDLLIPDELWSRISGVHELLCGQCIVRRSEALGEFDALHVVDGDALDRAEKAEAEQDALFGDRLAGGVVDVPKTAEDRVAQKLGAVEVETETGEVIEADIVAEGTPVDAERVDVPRQEGLL
jgi:hypothetical protein